jgi:hypothetical protein
MPGLPPLREVYHGRTLQTSCLTTGFLPQGISQHNAAPAVFCALLAVLSAVLFVPEVLGYGEQCVLYVAEDGIDRGDCRNANVPCRTLIDALDCASKGDKTALPPEATCSIQRSCGGRAAAQ